MSSIQSSPPTSDKSLKSWIFGFVIVFFLGGISWYLVSSNKSPAGFGAGAGAGAGAPRGGMPPMMGGDAGGVTVGLAVAKNGALPVFIDALGTATSSNSASITPQVSGILTKVLFKEGQFVHKGQLLAEIDSSLNRESLDLARAQESSARAQLTAARQTLKRYETLWQQDSIARQELDTQAALVEQLKAGLSANVASSKSAEINLGYTKIKAPISGRIGLRSVDVGNLVSASTPIGTITQVSPMDVTFSISQNNIENMQRAIKDGGQIPVIALSGDKSKQLASGHFLTMDNQIDAATASIKAKARFDNENEIIFPNQFVNVQMKIAEISGVIVPTTAVRTSAKGEYVYVVDDSAVAHLVDVRTGGTSRDSVLILEGVSAGQKVVIEGGDRVKDGAKVTLPNSDNSSAPSNNARNPRMRSSGKSSSPAPASAPAPAN